MASTDFDTFGNPPFLNPNEHNLLLNALKSNKDGDNAENNTEAIDSNLTQLAPDSEFFDPSLLEGDFPQDFDWNLDANALNELRGDGAGSSDGDDGSPGSADGKRKDHPDDDEDESPGKRREGEEKIAKKPGRKPLTSEPTSKRKAQNRAAQRAFRERKEKHLRDLETKVEDLEKASEATNHENGILRAQVDKLQAEISEYKKRIGSSANPTGYSPTAASNRINWDLGSSFNFEFPNFGQDSSAKSSTTTKKNGATALQALNDLEKTSADQSFFRLGPNNTNSPSPGSFDRSLSMSTSAAGSSYFGGKKTRSPTASTEKTVSNSASPASLGLGSSCVTTPEALVDSPQTKSMDNRIISAGSPAQPKTPGQESLAGVDWFGASNNGLFDPILFGDYEETQKNILNNADLSLNNLDTFPWNLDSTTSGIWSQSDVHPAAAAAKKSLLDQVEQAADAKEYDDSLMKPAASESSNQLTCAKLWDRVQRSEKVLSGEADMDDLCSQLKAKAKCGGPNKGAVVDERDVDAILGPDPNKLKKPTGMWSMFS